MNYRKQLDFDKAVLMGEDHLRGDGTLEIIEGDMKRFAVEHYRNLSKSQRSALMDMNTITDGGGRHDAFFARWAVEGGALPRTTIMLRTIWDGVKIPLPEIYSNFCHEAGHCRCYLNGCECYLNSSERFLILREKHACESALKMTATAGGRAGIYWAVSSAYGYMSSIYKGHPIFKALIKSPLYQTALKSLPLDKQLMFL